MFHKFKKLLAKWLTITLNQKFIEGKGNENAGNYESLSIDEIRKQIIHDLDKKGHIEKIEDYEIKYKDRVKLKDLSSLAKKQLALEEWN